MKVSIVLDLTFGDSGKGLVVDNLSKGKESLVVRFSGGQQVGHTVVAEGFRHVFSNMGAGTLRGSHTYYTKDTTMYLNTLFREIDVLVDADKFNMGFRQYYHPLAMVTTPYDVIANRMAETKQGHGSCGLGIGTTMKRNTTPYKFYVSDLLNPAIFEQKLEAVKFYYSDLLFGSTDLHKMFNDQLVNELEDFCEYVEVFRKYHKQGLIQIKTIREIPDQYTEFIMEGSQGIMLDMDHGMFPNVTYANTTCKNALAFLQKYNKRAIYDIETYYVTRCYQTRHGAGWMSNEDEIQLINNENETNTFNKWQKEFRTGELDVDLLKHAIRCDEAHHDMLPSNRFKRNLVVTCRDQRPDFDMNALCAEFYRDTHFEIVWSNNSPERGNFSTHI